ncbi:polysaccharide deacetylase family protein [Bifidobacterium stellenboschense]|uniref:Secreted polysaccharide deacetylase n=1 Tax=Bifidobacterium stellenboschense TaxID=762211 RepID=A0A087DX12_9BIFI|nr:polysaccharide deacetylase family protein [Bifidobacterium stellenboschense]KFJ00063.1 secreted polysaccharide deacetylase [Bifidobacterium stellenboschense]
MADDKHIGDADDARIDIERGDVTDDEAEDDADDMFRELGDDAAEPYDDGTTPGAADAPTADAATSAGTTGITGTPDTNGADGGATAARRRPKPLVVALVAAFAAGAVFAGVAVTRSILDLNARNHASALAYCRRERAQYTETLTGYTPVARQATALLKETASLTGSDSRARLQQQMDAMRDADVTAPAEQDCAADARTADIAALGDRYAAAASAMADGLISIRYDTDTLTQMKDGLNAQDARKQLTTLIARAKLAYDRSAGKADETARDTLKNAIDTAQSVLDTTPSDAGDAVNEQIQPISEATAKVIALMPLDCHFTDCVALTFDDGPNKQTTPKVLDALKAAGVPATFFLQGQFVSGSNVKLVGRMAAEGHSVGSMSWRHTQMHAMPADQLAKWFKDTDSVISSASGKPVTLFRPPDGAWSDALRSQAKASGQAMILWGVDSGDWGKLDAAEIEKRTLDGAYAGSIISLRDGNPETVKALPGIIKGLQAKGYHIVTVDTLLAGDIQPGSVAYGLNDVQ